MKVQRRVKARENEEVGIGRPMAATADSILSRQALNSPYETNTHNQRVTHRPCDIPCGGLAGPVSRSARISLPREMMRRTEQQNGREPNQSTQRPQEAAQATPVPTRTPPPRTPRWNQSGSRQHCSACASLRGCAPL